MAEQLNYYASLENLQYYDTKIKEVISAGDQAAKNYADGLADNYDPAGAATTAKGEAVSAAQGYTDTEVGKVNTAVGSVNSLQTTNKTIVGAVNEVLAAVGAGGTAAAMTLEKGTAAEGMAATYVLKQGGTEIGKIDIPKDMVVSSGQVIEKNGATYIELTLANVDEPILIDAAKLVDVYTAAKNAAQVQLAISSTGEISATIVAGSITSTELAANAVITGKIADKNVTKAKLAQDVQTSLGLADTAVQPNTLSAQVQTLTNADTALSNRIKTVEDAVGNTGSVATAIATAKSEAIAAAAADATTKANTAKTEAVAAAATDATTKANAAEQAAKSYADGLVAKFTPITTADIDKLFE